MLRVVPALVAIGLLVYCLIDCRQSAPNDVRIMPRWAWALLIVLLPVAGPLFWLWLGRPRHVAKHDAAHPGTTTEARPVPPDTPPNPFPSAPLGPDDDPEFIERLRHEEAERRRQEQEQPPPEA